MDGGINVRAPNVVLLPQDGCPIKVGKRYVDRNERCTLIRKQQNQKTNQGR
jgi:hypothetical protein